MDINEMVLRCLEIFQAGYDADCRLVGIDWAHWTQDPTPEIRCVFSAWTPCRIRCVIYPSISGTHGVNLDTKETWKLPYKVLLREERK